MGVPVTARVIEILGAQISALVIENAEAKAFLERVVTLSKDVLPEDWVCHNGAVLVPEKQAAALREIVTLMRPVV